MSLFDYRESIAITRDDPSFSALIMAAMRKADTRHLEALKAAFPDIWAEIEARYAAPAGRLPGEPE